MMAKSRAVTDEEFSIPKRKLSGIYAKVLTAFMLAASLFHLYNGGLGAMSTMDVRALHLIFMLSKSSKVIEQFRLRA